MITIYVHYNSLKAFLSGEWINGKLQFVNQYDIELQVDLKDVVLSYQQNGFTLRRKKWYEKLLHFKSII